jgi:hypothetical protein
MSLYLSYFPQNFWAYAVIIRCVKIALVKLLYCINHRKTFSPIL